MEKQRKSKMKALAGPEIVNWMLENALKSLCP